MSDKQGRKKIRDYFSKKVSFGWPVFLIVVGVFVYAVNSEGYNPYQCVGVGIVLFGVLWGEIALGQKASLPSDHQIDRWLEDDLSELSKHALRKLDLLPELLTNKEPLRVLGPILWSTPGVSDKDLLWKKGRDEYVRFSVYSVVMIYTAEHLLAAYECDFNMLKNVMLNENTYEFHYQDIVSVTTHETSTSYTLPNNEKMVVGQEFKVSVPGESINVIVDSQALFKITKGDMYHKDEVEKTVQRLRSLLRDKKQSLAAKEIHTAPSFAQPGSSMPAVPESVNSGLEAPPPSNRNAGSGAAGAEVRFCSNCGRQVQPAERFCSSCGKQLRA